MLTAPQHGHTFEIRWYSVTFGGGTGATSTTWRR
jgi:hypothetical protein